jgi:hypothetical protein
MANASIAFGLRPVRTVSGAPYTGAFREYTIPASDGTAVYIGDLVTGVGTSSTVNGVQYQDVTISATGGVFQGVVVGFKPDTATSLPYRAASTLRVVRVCDDPSMLYEVKDGASGTALTAADIGLNANIVVVAGSTVTGYSGTTLDNTTEATTNTLDVKLVELMNRADNEIGSASASWLVRLNRHRFVNQIAGI